MKKLTESVIISFNNINIFSIDLLFIENFNVSNIEL